MPLKLKRGGEGVWFDYLDGCKFKVRPLQPKDYLDIRERAKTLVPVSDGTKTDYAENFNNAAILFDSFQYTLEDWEGVDVEGVTDKAEIRKALFNKIEIRDFISLKANELFEKQKSEIEGQLKNSEGSQSGYHRKDTRNAPTAGKSTVG